LILKAAGDGVFHEDEKNLIGKVAVTLNVDGDDLKRMMSELSSERQAS
jgi:hypothetical protein